MIREVQPGDVPVGVGLALQAYCQMMSHMVAVRGTELLETVANEVRMGWREQKNPEDGPKSLTVEYIAERSNMTGHPMFESEVSTFLSHLRHFFMYPFDIVGDTELEGEKLVTLFTHEEFIMLCTYLEEQTKGAGRAMYGGRLKENIRI